MATEWRLSMIAGMQYAAPRTEETMICEGCGTENEPGGRFCEACGTALAASCPSCGSLVRADARFCRECGTRLKTDADRDAHGSAAAPAVQPVMAPRVAPAAPVAERRLVSVLFADLVGFTSLAEDRDPESTRELLTGYFDVAREAIERHGGTIEKFIGDAVMAVWGTPIAREDDAERAVRAALELVHAVPSLAPALQARAGILTGEAAVTIGATNQGMVAGDLVNTAARLQGVAEPGTVLVGEPTMRAAERAIVFEEVGEHSLKGKLAPVPAWRAVRVVAQRGGLQRTDVLEPPFVGRDEELRLLKEQLHAPGRDQRARLVSITGPGGIGKSRLVWELEKYMDGITEPVYWHRGRSPSYGEGVTFWALGEMVRRRARLTEDDDEATTRERIRATVEEYVADPEERQMVEPALLTLLGLGETGGGRDALFPAWRTFFERVSEKGTAVLVFEDLQWADTGLLDFIDHLLDWSKSRPILVVTLARPELFDKRPDWGVGRRAFTSLALDPLSGDAVRQLLAGIVPGLPPAAVATIVSRAEGMPLYAVETVRALLAEGKIQRDGDVYRPVGDLSALSVPESLRSLIASRLDALDPSDRALLQDASVLGQVFDIRTLAQITGIEPATVEERLRDLARREMVELETDPRSPERGQYKFVQALIREVAQGMLALRDRRSRHLAVARHYESLGDDELAGALASHYLAAYEASSEGEEADAVGAQARIALRAAADRAAALGSHEQAISHIQRALAITTDPRERGELLERAAIAALRGETGTAEEYASEAEDAFEEAGDAAGVYRTIALRGHIRVDGADLEGAAMLLERAPRRPDWPPAPELEAEVLVALSRAYMRLNRTPEALAAADRALEIAERMNLEQIVADALNNRAAALANHGRRREATALLREAVALAKAGGWTDLELRLLNNLSVSLVDDDPAAANRNAREMLTIAERIGSVQWYLISAAASAGSDYAELVNWDEAIALTVDARGRAIPGSYTWTQIVTAELPLRAARREEIDSLLDLLQREKADEALGWWVDMMRADAALAAGDVLEGERLARAALESARIEGNEPQVAAFLVYSLAAQGRAADARRAADDMRDSVFQGRLSKALQAVTDAASLATEGREGEARGRFQEGFDALRRMEQGLDLARWQILAVALLPDAPETPNWAAEARRLLEPVGARAYLDRLDAAMPASLRAAATRAVPASAGTEQVAEPS
jgi:class 3 adenylate cyclase/tetratricopeptide (TPR) repeat protein